MQLLRTFYYAKITLIDDKIGEIVRALKEKGVLDSTLIIYTSDHGEMAGDHRLNQKITFYEGALKVPCIIKPPAGMTGWQSTALTDHIDLVATMLDTAGAKPLEECDGTSLLSKMEAGPTAAGANRVRNVVFSEVIGYSMVFDGRYKLAVDARTGQPVEMLDLQEDPQELRNIVDEPASAKSRDELKVGYLDPLLARMDKDLFAQFEKRPNRTRGAM
jgi:arylsulfatase A-like enzyme